MIHAMALRRYCKLEGRSALCYQRDMKITIKALNETLSVCHVEDYSLINLSLPFCFTANTPGEKSLVCRTADVPQNAVKCEDGWSAFVIEGELDFSLIGILSGISSSLAAAGIGIFAISTYNTDYILVKSENMEKAVTALQDAGYTVIK